MVKCESCKYSIRFTDGLILCNFKVFKTIMRVTANYSCQYDKQEKKDERPD